MAGGAVAAKSGEQKVRPFARRASAKQVARYSTIWKKPDGLYLLESLAVCNSVTESHSTFLELMTARLLEHFCPT